MNKKEFIIEAALRMVSQGMPITDIPQAARQLADELYPEAPVHHGKPETDPIEVLLKEVERVEIEKVRERGKTYHTQMSGFAVRLRNVFRSEEIFTVADLLKRGRREFQKMRNVGQLCIEVVDQAIQNLYNITVW
ncbi:MAG: hypothetical protein IJ588_01130 [Prevotella sp.]|nr:hypothetical protein [Prevotella sp.]